MNIEDCSNPAKTDNMDIDNLESCNICMEIYSDVIRPRSPPCGHSICESCIRKSTTGDLFTCPHCQKTSSKSTNDFPINFGMEALLLEVRKLKYGATQKQQWGSAPIKTQSKSTWQEVLIDQVNSLKNLINNGEEQENVLLKYKDFVHQRKEHHLEQLKKISDIVSQQNETITQLDDAEKRLSSDITRGRKNIETATNELKSCDNARQEEIIGVCDKVMKCCQTFEKQNSKIQRELPNVEMIRNSDKLSRETAAALIAIESQPDGFRNAPLGASYSSIPLMDAVKHIRGEPTMSVSSLVSMTQPTKELLKKGHLYAIQNEQGRIRSARISSAGGKIYLSYLKDEEPPITARTIKHSEVIGLLKKDSVMAFMDLTRNGSALGRMHILLSPDTPLAQHFRILCTGDLGFTYAQSRFFAGSEKNVGDYISTYVAGGDYANNDGTEGAPLTDGLNPGDSIYSRTLEAGNIYTRFYDVDGTKIAQFEINIAEKWNSTNYSNFVQPIQSGVFGKVQDGLNIFSSVFSYIHQVIVEDCGVVLPI